MRLRHPSGEVVHLAYCTNVHGGERVEEMVGQLDRYAVPVRERLDVDRLGVGLWLSAPVARGLAADPRRAVALRAELSRRGLETVTLNGFPYRGFQDRVVKHAVYRPDWSQEARLAYTLDLVDVLALLLPDDAARGSISTVPLGWREPWDDARARCADERVDELAGRLRERPGGREVRVGFEPEPGCVVETTAKAAAAAVRWDREVLGVCLDLCHLAVQFETARTATRTLATAGVPVVKAQVSAALHVADPADPAARAALATFDEERFLHQVRAGTGETVLPSRDDLDEALRPAARGTLPTRDADGTPVPWRVHFHVPLGRAPEPPLTSTTDDLRASLTVLVGGDVPLTDHLEVETYTWSVVPPRSRPRDETELAVGLADELAWVRDELVALGLEPC